MSKKILDGSKMKPKEFYRKFREIVGVYFGWWIRRPSVKSRGGGEWYDYEDENFLLGGTAYSPPVLYRKRK